MLLPVCLLLALEVSFQLCYTPQELQAMFKEKIEEFEAEGVLPIAGLTNKIEKTEHFKAFARFADMVKKHNDEPGATWFGVLNYFSVMTETEKRAHLGLNASRVVDEARESIHKRSITVAPLDRSDKTYVDYADKLPPAKLKGQGGCGACWVFAAVATLEYQLNRYSDEITSLSEQHYVDCAYEPTGDACNGGWPTDAYKWTMNHDNMISKEDEYPAYTQVDGVCKTAGVKSGMGDYRVIGYSYIPGGDDEMEAAVADPKYGVLSVAIGVNGGFYAYGSGVYHQEGCNRQEHLVAVVGYGIQDGEQYWNVRNSWGPTWGEKGYIKMKRGHKLNTCGLTNDIMVPLVIKEGDTNAVYNDNETGKECRDSGDERGSKYRGTINRTKSGRLCQKWTSQTPQKHNFAPIGKGKRGLGDHNYCRNPNNSANIWCYNSEGTSPKWQKCIVPVCRECTWHETVGTASFTKSNAMNECDKVKDCKAITCDGDFFCWLSDGTSNSAEPKVWVYTKETNCTNDQIANPQPVMLERRNNDNIIENTECKWKVQTQGTAIFINEDAKKKCATIEKCTGITCESSKSCWLNIKFDADFKKTYTTYVRECSGIAEDYNDNELGAECRAIEDTKGSEYRGTLNQTLGGLKCLNWADLSPFSGVRSPQKYQDEGLGSHNYCRNPDGKKKPWCYYKDSYWTYGYCDILACEPCEWEDAVQGTITHRKEGARKDCEASKECQAFTCRGDEDCWLNFETATASEKVLTTYAKKTTKIKSDEVQR